MEVFQHPSHLSLHIVIMRGITSEDKVHLNNWLYNGIRPTELTERCEEVVRNYGEYIID